MPELSADPLVVAFLQGAGFSDVVAAKVALVGEVLRRLARVARPSGTEYAALLDAATGEAVGPEVRGSVVGEVEFAPLEAGMVPGRSYAVVHTHWLGSFSLDDARLFAATEQIAGLLAVTRDGRWYSFTGREGANRASIRDLDRRYLTEVNRVRRELARRIMRGEMTELEALAEIEHVVWERISASVGVRYDRSG